MIHFADCIIRNKLPDINHILPYSQQDGTGLKVHGATFTFLMWHLEEERMRTHTGILSLLL